MILLGVILLILGFLTGIAILWTLGIIVLVIGLILMLAGVAGHAIGPRRHYWLPAVLHAWLVTGMLAATIALRLVAVIRNRRRVS
jgi:membrane-bound ClpP family serine protease